MKKFYPLVVTFFIITNFCFAQSGWFYQNSSPQSYHLNSVKFVSSNVGYAVGTGGTILSTVNGGLNWISQSSGTTNELNSVSFTDANNGTTVGDSGIILRTTNGGFNWILQSSGTTQNLLGVFFTDSNIGTTVGNNGTILRTIDGGNNWSNQMSGTLNGFNGVFFINSNIGTAVGVGIQRTINGGINWTSQSTGTSGFTSVSFTDANTGTAVGFLGRILRTTNGGTNWNLQISGTNESLRGVSFTDANYGTAVGSNFTILRTTNGGTNWTLQFESLSRLHGDQEDVAEYLLSIKNGTDWLLGVSFTDSLTGTAVGTNGTILRTTSGGVISVNQLSNHVPDGFILSQNYPNPFNPKTNIEFSIPKQSNVKITVYDAQGKEVASLLDQKLSAGTYKVDFDGAGYSSGVYFYKLETEGFVETRSMVLLK